MERPSVTIDLVTHDPGTDEFVLYILEDVPFPNTEAEWIARLRRLQDRIWDAVDAAVDGGVAAVFPDAAGKKVRIQVDSPQARSPRIDALVQRIGEHLVSDPEYRTALEQSRFVSGIRVVTGHEMGRFQRMN